MRNKIKGMIIGGAIGDALGAPVETWKPNKIKEVHGKLIDGYVSPIGHKWFDPDKMPAGSTTDDTQLVVAVMQGIIDAKNSIVDLEKEFSIEYKNKILDSIAKYQVLSIKEANNGFGKTTLEAIERISQGVHWSESGKTQNKNRGTGNGGPMKIAPVAALCASKLRPVTKIFLLNEFCVKISSMTHYTKMSAIGTIVHANILYSFLNLEKENIIPLKDIIKIAQYNIDDKDFTANLDDTTDNLFSRLNFLQDFYNEESTVEELSSRFGGGSCYLYDSLPFSYSLFLRNPNSFQSIIDAANAGGDNDTNAKFVGEMIGALHGLEFFRTPENIWACEGLVDYNKLIDLVDKFCDSFNIK